MPRIRDGFSQYMRIFADKLSKIYKIQLRVVKNKMVNP